MAASIENISSGYACHPTTATLLVMPLFHGLGYRWVAINLGSGGSAYVPSTVRSQPICSGQMCFASVVTWYTAVPTIHRIFLTGPPANTEVLSVPLRFNPQLQSAR